MGGRKLNDMNLTDSIAFASRKLAQTRLHKVSEALRRYYPVKSGLTMIHNFDGDLTISVDRASYVSSAIYWRGHHCTHVAKFLQDYLRPNMTFVDVGANMGELTLVAGKRLAKGRVLAFEPVPQIFAELSRNVALNNLKCVELFNIGLFDSNDSLPMYRLQDINFGTINEGVPSLFSTGSDRQEVVVPLRRFDDVARERGLQRLDVIKVDVEGAEIMVLRGAEASIRRFRPIIITEMSDANFQRAGYTSTDLISYLMRLGYDAQILDDPRGRLPLLCDAICFPRESSQSMTRMENTTSTIRAAS
jgi:FkbM family methyltransferase